MASHFQGTCHPSLVSQPQHNHSSVDSSSRAGWLSSSLKLDLLPAFPFCGCFRRGKFLSSSAAQNITSSPSRVGKAENARLCDGKGQIASIYNQELNKGLSRKLVPSRETYIPLLQLCLRKNSLADAKEVHANIVKNGVKLDSVLGESLVNTLVKCGSLCDALEVFSRLAQRTVFSWTVIISEYIRTRQYDEALRIYCQMRATGVEPNEHTLVAILKACASLANLDEGKRAHVEVIQRGYGSNLFVSNSLMAMYSSCRKVLDAKHVFDMMPYHDLVAWNTMIAGYAQHELSENALKLYAQMREQGVKPDARTFVALLQACVGLAGMEEDVYIDTQAVKTASLQLGKSIHAEVLRSDFLPNSFLSSNLVHLYATCGSLADARHIFYTFSQDDVVSWTAMIAAYAQQKQSNRALESYLQMQQEGVWPNDRTFVSMLKACSGLAAAEEGTFIDCHLVKVDSMEMGRKLHGEASRRGYVCDLFVASSLVSMYSSCGSLVDAEIVFASIAWPDVVSWTAMISSYAQQEQAERALQLYDQMQEMGIRPNNWTLVSVLQACASLAARDKDNLDAQSVKEGAALYKGKLVHAALVKSGYESDPFVGNALVHMYASCGSPEDALHVFSTLSARDVVSWTAMIGAYAQDEQGKAWQLYTWMKKDGVKPNEATFLGILKACSNAGALQRCCQVHADILESRIMCTESLGTAVMHAYAKCGDIVAAQALFDSLLKPDVVSWSALIAAYARRGDSDMSLQLYSKMQEAGIKPNGATLVAVLSACSHTGLVDKGIEYFLSMTTIHGIDATSEHYACIVDLLGRAGKLDKAQDLLSQMPVQKDLTVWSSLLGSYRKHFKG